jgi:hypothetical protein
MNLPIVVNTGGPDEKKTQDSALAAVPSAPLQIALVPYRNDSGDDDSGDDDSDDEESPIQPIWDDDGWPVQLETYGPPGPDEDEHRSLERRVMAVHQLGWGMFDLPMLDAIARATARSGGFFLGIGSGSGVIEGLLSLYPALNSVLATDVRQCESLLNRYIPVETYSALEAVQKYPCTTALFCSWPSAGSWFVEALVQWMKNVTNNKVLILNAEEGGTCADKHCFKLLAQYFYQWFDAGVTPWPNYHDKCVVYLPTRKLVELAAEYRQDPSLDADAAWSERFGQQ